jgi:bifunctional non-homologous end joining protein LigD
MARQPAAAVRSAAKRRAAADPQRQRLNKAAVTAPDLHEHEHFYRCDECGQVVDRRRLGDVLHHEQAGHQPLAADDPLQSRRPKLQFVEPMAPTLVDEPPGGAGWIHEIKYDGYRTELIVEDGRCRAFTRRGFDWTDRYAAMADAAAALPCESAILDGEVIVQDARGRSDFHALRRAIEARRGGLVFMAFDLLHLDGRDLRPWPVERRRAALEKLLASVQPNNPIQFSAHVEVSGAEFLAAADAMGLEGIVSKKLGSRYRSGAAKTWLKTKTFAEDDYVVIGTAKGDRAPVALLASENRGKLEYVGAAMVTLPDPDRDLFWTTAEKIRSAEPPLPMEPRKETGWVRPEMRVRVRHLRGEEMLRHATVKAITALPEGKGAAKSKAGRKITSAKRSDAGGVGSSTPEPIYTRPDISSEAIADYYRRISRLILPWAAGRPLNLYRCPRGHCLFQRHESHPPAPPGTFGAAIQRLPVRQKNGKTQDYLWIEDKAGLLACVEAEAVEFHGWGSRVDDIERPDRMVIDLDPDAGLPFAKVREAAMMVREELAGRGLESFPLLTGGKGIHVVVPLAPEAEWPAVREWARQFSDGLAQAEPARFTAQIAMERRRGRILLDYLRNQRGSTAVLPYSARARDGSPVAAPVAWNELEGFDSAASFSIQDAAQLLARSRTTALRGWGKARQRLP